MTGAIIARRVRAWRCERFLSGNHDGRSHGHTPPTEQQAREHVASLRPRLLLAMEEAGPRIRARIGDDDI